MALLLLHGLGGDRRQPLSLLEPILPEGTRMFAPDLRAHGDSPLIGGPADFAFPSMTAELVDSIRDKGFADEPLTVIGISLGAALSLRLEQSAQVQLDRLVLLRPAFTDAPFPPNLGVFPVVAELLHAHPPEQAEAEFRRTDLYRSLRAASRLGAAGVIEQFRSPDASARAIRLAQLPRNRAFEPDDRPLNGVPTTIIAAPRDPLHPVQVAAGWHRMLPGSTLIEVPARDDGMAAYLAATRAAVAAAVRTSPQG